MPITKRVKVIRNYMKGAGSVLELYPSPRKARLGRVRRVKISAAERDGRAIASHWRSVGRHIESSMDTFEKEGRIVQ